MHTAILAITTPLPKIPRTKENWHKHTVYYLIAHNAHLFQHSYQSPLLTGCPNIAMPVTTSCRAAQLYKTYFISHNRFRTKTCTGDAKYHHIIGKFKHLHQTPSHYYDSHCWIIISSLYCIEGGPFLFSNVRCHKKNPLLVGESPTTPKPYCIQ